MGTGSQILLPRSFERIEVRRTRGGPARDRGRASGEGSVRNVHQKPLRNSGHCRNARVVQLPRHRDVRSAKTLRGTERTDATCISRGLQVRGVPRDISRSAAQRAASAQRTNRVARRRVRHLLPKRALGAHSGGIQTPQIDRQAASRVEAVAPLHHLLAAPSRNRRARGETHHAENGRRRVRVVW